MYTWRELVALYRLTDKRRLPTYNRVTIFAPRQQVDVVVRGDDQHSLVPMRWGLIPGW